MKRKQIQILVLLLLLLAVPPFLRAQADRGTITGTVSDSSGAVVGSVEIVATQTATGAPFKAVSNNLGFYSLVQLPVGSYTVSFRKSGFKDLNRTGIIIEAQHTVLVDVALEVGSVSETVQVTGTPVLELQTEVGTNMTSQAMIDLPTSVNGGRDITAFAFSITPNISGNNWQSSIGGSQNHTENVLIDGTSADSGVVGHIAEQEPSMDAIQESQVDTTGLRAEDGRSGGGAFLYEMKSGTNEFHGAAFGFLANEFLDANSWTNKWWLSQCTPGNLTCENPYRRTKNRYFDYGFSGGGPIWKARKMFIFAAYEKYLQADWTSNPTGATVPTAKMLTGDFSELLTAAATAKGAATCPSSPCPILMNGVGSAPYTDPAGNTIYYGSIFSPNGTVYSGNIITDPISSRSQQITNYLSKYYQPTTPGVVNNYPTLTNGYPWFHQTQLSFKYDWIVTDNDHVAVSYIYTLRPRITYGGPWSQGSQTGGPLTTANTQTVISNSYRGNETHTFSPNLLNVAAYTFNGFQDKRIPTDTSAGPKGLGYDSIDATQAFPYISLGGSPNGLGEPSFGTEAGSGYVAYNAIVNDTLNWTTGRHSLKFGVEYRELGFNYDANGGELAFAFTNNTFAPTNAHVQPYVGSAFANMLLGQVDHAVQITSFDLYSRRKEMSFFVQDDIHISPKLTINADLRWELTRPLHETNGHWTNFDVTNPNPLFNGIPGTVTWLKHPSDSFETNTDWHQIGPAVGAAYQLNSKIVFRGSAGINFVPLGWNTYDGTPFGAAVGYTSVSRVNQILPQTPAFQWDSQPYPGVYTPPTGPAPNSTFIPSGPANIDPNTRQLGFTEHWHTSVQYQLPGNAKIELSYAGNSGRNLHDGQLVPYNYPTWSTYQTLLQSGHVSDTVSSASTAETAGVPYPYPGFKGLAYYAINPFPQVKACACGGVHFTNSPLGQSGYNSITVEGTKQRGYLNLDLSYFWTRTTGNSTTAFVDDSGYGYGWQDPYRYKYEAHWPTTYNKAKGYMTYVLPLGNGRRFLSNAGKLDFAVSGWTLGTIVSYSNGDQFPAVNASTSYPGWSSVYTDVAAHPNFKNLFKRYNPGWNPTVAGTQTDPDSLFFDPTNFSNPAYGQLGNSPTKFSNWRGWGYEDEDVSLLKKTKIGSDGRYVLTVRAEFFNVFNRHYWGSPSTSFSSAYFGHVTGVSGNRIGQLGARFEW